MYTRPVCIGLADDDTSLAGSADDIQRCSPPQVATAVRRFSAPELAAQRGRCGGAAPLCWMWGELAEQAQQAFQPQWTVLTQVELPGWPRLLAGALLHCNDRLLPPWHRRPPQVWL